ncbi:MAG: ArdC-like ssDNA-binding domain-containing protein [Verrucomicrobiae bacterium]|nr:ArdC-like ssDNA-binding domain-containing protein [Verrucomicrobiae bacterium]
MIAQEIASEALTRATTSPSLANYPAIFEGFTAKGIAPQEIRPRENVFTFHAWKALGRRVRKGEHGVKVATLKTVTKRERDEKSGEEKVKSFSLPWTATVFHISQTEACRPGQS